MRLDQLKTAFDGVDCVFHLAAVVKFNSEDPQRDIVDPAVEGTKACLKALEESESVVRLVYTSSIAAVVNLADPYANSKRKEGESFDESDWNLSSDLKSGPYRYGKRVSEELVWKWIKSTKPERITVAITNPGLVIGKSNEKKESDDQTLTMSLRVLYDIITGKREKLPGTTIGVVDIEDVVMGHILVSRNKKCEGRYIINSECISWVQLWEEARSFFFGEVEHVEGLLWAEQNGLNGFDEPYLPFLRHEELCIYAYKERGITVEQLQKYPIIYSSNFLKMVYEIGGMEELKKFEATEIHFTLDFVMWLRSIGYSFDRMNTTSFLKISELYVLICCNVLKYKDLKWEKAKLQAYTKERDVKVCRNTFHLMKEIRKKKIITVLLCLCQTLPKDVIWIILDYTYSPINERGWTY